MDCDRKKSNKKVGLITSEMSWQERLYEYRKVYGDHDEVMSLTPQGRALVAFAMFSEHRRDIIKSIPGNLSEREFKEELYFRTYGERLPDYFFKDEVV